MKPSEKALSTWKFSQIFKRLPELESCPEIWQDVSKLAIYLQCRLDHDDPGHRFASMCANRRAPRCGVDSSDRTFNEVQRRYMQRMNPRNLERMTKAAQAAGINTNGKFYTGIGRYTDPGAWASTIDDAQATLRRKNLGAFGGGVKNTAVEEPPAPKVKLAPDIVDDYVRDYIRKEPETREKVKKKPKAIQELRERVIDTHAPKY